MGMDGEEGGSAYISQNGRIMSLTCDTMQVKPTGENTAFPPTPANHSPTGFSISMDVQHRGKFEVEVENTRVISDVRPSGMRWIGKVKGGFAGGPQYSGNALYDQFVFS